MVSLTWPRSHVGGGVRTLGGKGPRSSICLLTYSLTYQFIYSFIHSLIHSQVSTLNTSCQVLIRL